MKKMCLVFALIAVLVITGVNSLRADESSFGVNPPMDDAQLTQESSVARDLVERGLVPLDGEGWAKRPILPAAGYNSEGIADSSPPANVSRPLSPSGPSAPTAPKL